MRSLRSVVVLRSSSRSTALPYSATLHDCREDVEVVDCETTDSAFSEAPPVTEGAVEVEADGEAALSAATAALISSAEKLEF